MTKRTNKRNTKTRTGAYQRNKKIKEFLKELLVCIVFTAIMFFAMLEACSDTSDLPVGKPVDDGTGIHYVYDNEYDN